MLRENETKGNPGGLEIGTLDASETAEALDVLSRGMRDNPVHVAVFGADPETRRRKLHRLFGTAMTGMGWERHMLVALRPLRGGDARVAEALEVDLLLRCYRVTVARAGAALDFCLDPGAPRGRARFSSVVVQKARHRSPNRRTQGEVLRAQGVGEALKRAPARVCSAHPGLSTRPRP